MKESRIPKSKRPGITVREQSAQERIKNFNEVPFGYNEEEAVQEALRCLQCRRPCCIEGCPVNIDIKSFIAQIAAHDFEKAISIIKKDNSLPAICGRACPQEDQCEAKCVLQKKGNPINIGALERFAADWQATNEKVSQFDITRKKDKNGEPIKVAIAGAGPAGLAVAGELVKTGYLPVVFEAMHLAGGVLVYGIPEFRLPKDIVQREIEYLKTLGVEFEFNTIIGKSYTLDDLREMRYKAIFIGVGAGTPLFLGIPGENLKGVYSANEILTRINAMKGYLFPEYDTPLKLGRKIAVVGAGNVAMDTARCCIRIPHVEEVYIVYRRSEAEMPARFDEIKRAKEEGIRFKLLTNPVEIISDEDGWVKALKCVQMKLGEPDASGRYRPVAIENSEFVIDVDTVIPALGTKANRLLTSEVAGLELDRRGNIIVDAETGKTSLADVFAGGDITTGSATIIAAMGAGKKAAKAIDVYLSKINEKQQNS